jgi:hypothetical protein
MLLAGEQMAASRAEYDLAATLQPAIHRLAAWRT